MIRIHNQSGSVLYESEASSIRDAVTEANLNMVDLFRANLAGADLARANIAGVDLTRADLAGADLLRANLAGANLAGADLISANLLRADLISANLAGTDLKQANLARADLAGADLTGSNLKEAKLTGAKLAGTCLDPAAPMPPLSNTEIIEAGLELRGDRVYGWRTKQSLYNGLTIYQPGEYVAPYFSVSRETACHPGIYLDSRDRLESLYPGIELVPGYCLRVELLHAVDKWRTRRLWIVEESDIVGLGGAA